MSDHDKRDDDRDDLDYVANANDQFVPITRRDEEVASEITMDDRNDDRDFDRDNDDLNINAHSVTGWIGLALSIISFFMFPIVFGIVGIVLGFIARARDAQWLGNTAIAVGVISIILRLFIRPMFF